MRVTKVTAGAAAAWKALSFLLVSAEPAWCEQSGSVSEALSLLDTVRGELKGPSILRLEYDVRAKDWADIIAYTQEYDLSFREAVVDRLRKNKAMRAFAEQVKLISNDLTDDLIGEKRLPFHRLCTYSSAAYAAMNRAAKLSDQKTAQAALESIKRNILRLADMRAPLDAMRRRGAR
jgi:hypothetical protein